MTHSHEEGQGVQNQPQQDEIALVGAQAFPALQTQGQSWALKTDVQAFPPQRQNKD